MRRCDVSFDIKEIVICDVDGGRVNLGMAVAPPRRDRGRQNEGAAGHTVGHTDGHTDSRRREGSQ